MKVFTQAKKESHGKKTGRIFLSSTMNYERIMNHDQSTRQGRDSSSSCLTSDERRFSAKRNPHPVGVVKYSGYAGPVWVWPKADIK